MKKRLFLVLMFAAVTSQGTVLMAAEKLDVCELLKGAVPGGILPFVLGVLGCS